VPKSEVKMTSEKGYIKRIYKIILLLIIIPMVLNMYYDKYQ